MPWIMETGANLTDEEEHSKGHLDAAVGDAFDVLADLIHDAHGKEHGRCDQIRERKL